MQKNNLVQLHQTLCLVELELLVVGELGMVVVVVVAVVLEAHQPLVVPVVF